MNQFFAVITTIQPPTNAVIALKQRLDSLGGRLVVAGDRKGPASFELPGVDFLPVLAQKASGFALAGLLPEGHYARKNIGYLHAIRSGARCIYETDDDNAPLASWGMRTETATARGIRDRGWINIYRSFSKELIWPRGFPLEEVRCGDRKAGHMLGPDSAVRAPIQQGLANNSPDVDAVWRLVMDRPFDFDHGPSIHLTEGSWCPFNSQSTWFWPDAFPLLYLPSFCSFRMTDIWRSFVAQRCLWAMGCGVVFHAPEVVQERNAHDLMRDFRDEVPGYLENARLARALAGLKLAEGADGCGRNLLTCYRELVTQGIIPADEVPLVEAWLSDVRNARNVAAS